MVLTSFFSLDGEQGDWVNSSLDQALKRSLRILKVSPPDQGSFSYHAMRIGTDNDAILLGIQVIVRLARFGWGAGSKDMAALYFDRSIRV